MSEAADGKFNIIQGSGGKTKILLFCKQACKEKCCPDMTVTLAAGWTYHKLGCNEAVSQTQRSCSPTEDYS